MVEKKLNVKKLGIFCGILLVILIILICVISGLIKDAKLRKTDEYKLGEVGYTANEIKVILNKLNDKEVDNIINSKYKKDLTKFLKEKYFIYDKLERYLSYYSDNKSESTKRIVAIVNAGADREWYSDIKETDTSKGSLMLVNKFNGLSESYVPEDLVLVSSTYALDGKYVSKSIYDDLKRMLDSCKEAGYTLVVSQGYRSYKDQLEVYKDIENVYDTETADDKAARAGHSEYQSGLGVDISTYGIKDESAILEAREYLVNNCYKYGFILRYPTDTEEITGFNADEWRLRYVGVDASSKIHSEGITFDEYYEYYVNN